MTNPPPDPQMAAMQAALATVQTTLSTLQITLEKLSRSVDGDTSVGALGLRQTLTDQSKRIETLELKAREQEIVVRTYTTMAKWASGGSLAGLIALGFAVFRAYGGHP